MIEITVDQRTIAVEHGANLLTACLEAGIYIPHLCHLPGLEPAASCRLCFVALDGEAAPVPACTVTVTAPLTVISDAPAVRRLQRSALSLLLSAHTIDCRRCPANRQCELQRIARFLGLPLKRPDLPPARPPCAPPTACHELVVDTTHCVLCGRCVRLCRDRNGTSKLSFAGRGYDTVVTDWVTADAPIRCADCGACITACPVKAIRLAPAQGE